jgi:heme oxygenase
MLAHLRKFTAGPHKAIEDALGLMRDDLNLETYNRVLARLYGFWAVWQPQVGRLIDDEPFLRPRQRLRLLEIDLIALGYSQHALDALPRCLPVPLRNGMEAIGSLYVMEGSSLGGRVVLKHLNRCLGPEIEGRSAYFYGYGDETGSMWRSFLARLDTVPLARKGSVCRGALATFEQLGAWIGQPD